MDFHYDPPTEPISPPPPRRRGCGGCLSRAFLGVLILAGLAIFAAIVVTGTLIYVQLSAEIEEGITVLENARERETFETTRITDRDGEVLWEIFGEGKRTYVALEQIPEEIQEATIAVEDDTFYENIGLDAPSLLAAIIANLRNRDERPVGGSTITQQIVRHIAFDYEERTAVSYNRKTKEVILAWMMNRKYSKDEILELYLNEVYYGNLAYGVEAAAQTYFGKPASELTLAESSLLAALPQSPVELDPLNNLERAKERQWLVLNLMVEEGMLGRTQAEAAYLETLKFAPQEVNLAAPHFAVYVRQLLEEQFGAETVANGGLRVTTTLDLNYQRLAERLAREHVDAVGPEHNLTNAALVALKPGSGEILAMLGSVDYRDETIDGNVNVTVSPQQPGSAIKPLTYAAALTPGAEGEAPARTAADILWDVPVRYPQTDGSVYAPVNYSRSFHGPLRMREALANSYNVPAVLVLQELGVTRFLEFAQRMGIESFGSDASRYGLSITLGGAELTPLELTSAYAVLANEGMRVEPVAIMSVETADGEILYERQPAAPEPVLDPRVAFLISDILDDDVARSAAMGRENPLALSFPAAAKTGTTNDFRDNWTVGYTQNLVVGVWSGNTDNSAMIEVSGLSGAAPLWSAYMQDVYGNEGLRAVLDGGDAMPAPFTAPPGMEQRPLCTIASVVPGAESCDFGDQEWFLVEAEQPPPTSPPPEPVVSRRALDPAVWQLSVAPLPAELPEEIAAEVTADGLPEPTVCYFDEGIPVAELPPEAAEGVFLEPPGNQESVEGAYDWAEEYGLAILPRVACTEDLLAVGRGDQNAFWRIRSPKDGDSVTGIVPVVGTADFVPEAAQFFKVEVGSGENPSEWLTLGETHPEPVVNGVLENFNADAFPPGTYTLQLLLIGWDGNHVGEPDMVRVEVE